MVIENLYKKNGRIIQRYTLDDGKQFYSVYEDGGSVSGTLSSLKNDMTKHEMKCVKEIVRLIDMLHVKPEDIMEDVDKYITEKEVMK